MRVEGLPVPYSIPSDNILSLVLLLCALLSVVIVMRSWKILSLRIRALFIRSTNLSNYRHTTYYAREETFFTLEAIISLTLICYSAIPSRNSMAESASSYAIMASLAGIFLAYYLLRGLLYHLTIPTYCNLNQWRSWKLAYHLLNTMQGMWFLPVALLNIYFHLSTTITAILVSAGIIITVFSRIYNAWCIFFRKKKLYVPFFLYLCTLEITPLALLAGFMKQTAEACGGL